MMIQTEELRIETSTCCHFHCLFCPRETFKRKKEVMATALFRELLTKIKKELPAISFLTLCGYGEFGLDDEWHKKLEIAKTLFPKVHLVTNLSTFDARALVFLLDHVSDIRVSAYAMDEDVYRRVHRPPVEIHFEEIKAKILYLIQKKKPVQHIILNYIQTEVNEGQTQRWIDYWKNKADLIEVWRPHNWLRGKHYRKLCSHRENSCYRPFSGPLQIMVDGKVALCCFDFNGEYPIGDALRDSIEAIYNSPQLETIQNLHRHGQADALPYCKICDQRNCIACRSDELIFDSKFTRESRLKAQARDFTRI